MTSPQARALTLAQELQTARSENQLDLYDPFPQQRAFHAAGSDYRERLLRAGNQLGKTFAGGAEMAMHLTGRYPDWWQGRRFDRPIVAWVATETVELAREGVQTVLLGPPGKLGTGALPKSTIQEVRGKQSVAEAVDFVRVTHISGGTSVLAFKTYAQGRERFQAAKVDVFWFDEEPSELGIYTEGLTRTNQTRGLVYLTFTPLKGRSAVVERFLSASHPDRSDTLMTLADSPLYTAEERDRIEASYPAHEREARTAGTPMMGQGRVFPFAESEIIIDPLTPHADWWVVDAMDFGFDHPTTFVRAYLDASSGTFYVAQEYAARRQPASVHAAAYQQQFGGSAIPLVWPHDGLQTSKDTGKALADQYRSLGLPMAASQVSLPGGGNSLEAAVFRMFDAMANGKWKVFSTCTGWLDEFRLYHRKAGSIVAKKDDILSASRYAMMGLLSGQGAYVGDLSAPPAEPVRPELGGKFGRDDASIDDPFSPDEWD